MKKLNIDLEFAYSFGTILRMVAVLIYRLENNIAVTTVVSDIKLWYSKHGIDYKNATNYYEEKKEI